MIIDREKIKSLAAAQSSNGGYYMSAFVSTSSLENWRKNTPTFLNSAFTEMMKERNFSHEEKRSLEGDLERIRGVLNYDITPQTEGLAVFADQAGGVFERIELPVRFEDRLVVGKSPYLRPLLCVLSLFEPFVVAQVSKDDSHLYLVDELRVVRSEDFSGPYLKSSNQETGEVPVKEYYAANRQESLIDQHHKEVAAAIDKMIQELGIQWVVLNGNHDIVSGFRRALSQRAAARVVGEFPLDATASIKQTISRARDAMKTGRAHGRQQLAERIRESLGAGGRGVAGFSDTAGALYRGQVQRLLVDQEYRPTGFRCVECDFVSLTQSDPCPVCGGGMLPVEDAAGEAMRVAVRQGTYVEIGEDIPALKELGEIAGLLRYG